MWFYRRLTNFLHTQLWFLIRQTQLIDDCGFTDLDDLIRQSCSDNLCRGLVCHTRKFVSYVVPGAVS